jgi:hypothetical protein
VPKPSRRGDPCRSYENIDDVSVEDLLEIAAGVVVEVGVRDPKLWAVAAGRPAVSVSARTRLTAHLRPAS